MTEEIVIITAHKGTVQWLALHGITGTVIERATVKDVRGKICFGVLPLRLAAYAANVVSLDLPYMTREQINSKADLTCEELTSAGAQLMVYTVTRKPYRTHNQELLGRSDADGFDL